MSEERLLSLFPEKRRLWLKRDLDELGSLLAEVLITILPDEKMNEAERICEDIWEKLMEMLLEVVEE